MPSLRTTILSLATVLTAAETRAQAVVDAANGRAYAVTAVPYTFADARLAAARLGGHLASFSDATERNFVYGAFLTQFRAGLHVWIGLTDEAAEGTFVWDDGTPPGLADWRQGEPNDCCGGEDHVEAFDDFGRLVWADAQGAGLRFALIEFPVAVSPFDGRAFAATASAVDRATARATAADAGGALAAIGSAAEEAWLAGAFAGVTATDAVWIGLTDETAEGQFVWENGDAFAYAHWAAGEPDDAGDADGVVMGDAASGYAWRDEPFAASFPALVEIAGVALPSSAAGDDCASAVVAALGPNPFNGAGYYLAGPAAPCSFSALPETYDCWFRYVAASDGLFVATTCPESPNAVGASATPIDTYLALWAGVDCASLSLIACEDVGPGCIYLQAEARTHVLAGQSIWIQVGAWGGGQPAAGAVSLALHADAPNDECATAIPLNYGVNPSAPLGDPADAFRNFGATTSAVGTACGGAEDLWFTFTAPYETRLSVSTAAPAGFPSGTLEFLNVAVLDACGGVELACGQTSVEFQATAGATYYLHVGGWSNNYGSYYLTVRDVYYLRMTAPFGAGSLEVANRFGPPGGFYYTFATPQQGSFPHGWLFGVDLTLFEYFAQSTAFAPPFFGVLDANGASSFVVPGGLPPLTLYGVSLSFSAAGAFGGPTVPVAFSIP